LSQPPRSANGTLYLIDRPGTTQSTITVGRVGFSGEADDYQALSAPVASKPALAGPPMAAPKPRTKSRIKKKITTTKRIKSWINIKTPNATRRLSS
jgi:hypothetical protein